MSKTTSSARTSVTDIVAMKGQNPIVALTAYTAPYAQLLDEQVDILLVGDSLGMVLYGMDNTLPVTLDMMIRHGKSVVDHSSHALVVVDMPFGTYQTSAEQAFTSCAKVMAETGCQAVKVEGGMEAVDSVRFLTMRGIPVMGHIGLKPQYVNMMGGYKYQGCKKDDEKRLIKEAKALEDAGAFSIVIEGVVESVATAISKEVSIPTIGIGASAACDGQVLVTEDMLGLFEQTPRFVECFGSIREHINSAVVQYANAVRDRTFPEDKHCFTPKKKGPKLAS